MRDHFLKRQNWEANEDRFYHIQVSPTLFGEWSVVIEWGRMGCPGTVRFTNWPSEAAADERALQMAQKKLKTGYVRRESPEFSERRASQQRSA